MKGILMFDNLNDVIFNNIDHELSQHIQKLAIKDGLLEVSSDEISIDKNIIMQLFSPLIASYKVMQGQFGNKYKYIETEDGLMLVFDEILNYVAVSISDDGEKLEDVQKELSIFLVVIEMLFGPSLHMLKNDILCDNTLRSELVVLILKKWKSLLMEQQVYLVEAVERLIINQDITAMCVSLLQIILEKVRQTHKEGNYLHAFALVDTKLLALYSSRNSGQLPKEILLLLIIVVQVLKTPTTPDNFEYPELNESDDEFFIPKSSVPKAEFSDKEVSYTKKTSNLKKEDKYKIGSHTLLLYLKSRTGELVPHILYVTEVTNSITLSILCELTSEGIMSTLIASLIKKMRYLQLHPLSRFATISYEELEKEFKTLTNILWKKKALIDREKHIKKLVTKWEQLRQCEIESFIEKANEKLTNPRLDSGLSSCCELLKALFEEVIALPCLKYEKQSRTPEHQEILKTLQKQSIKRFNDIADFLEVKAQQNITMSSYITEYPGLIHFIYVDRNCDCLIAPCLTLKKTHLNGSPSLKNKIWRMVSTGRRYIDGANNFCALWKDEDLAFFYNVWFEDSMGRLIKPTVIPNLKQFPKKGIICGNFYKKLIKECFPGAAYDHISCYEFFCAHLSTTPSDVIIEHSKQLCSRLWHFSGAYRTSLDLL